MLQQVIGRLRLAAPLQVVGRGADDESRTREPACNEVAFERLLADRDDGDVLVLLCQ
jgi:hypothetical protein